MLKPYIDHGPYPIAVTSTVFLHFLKSKDYTSGSCFSFKHGITQRTKSNRRANIGQTSIMWQNKLWNIFFANPHILHLYIKLEFLRSESIGWYLQTNWWWNINLNCFFFNNIQRLSERELSLTSILNLSGMAQRVTLIAKFFPNHSFSFSEIF